MEYKKAVKESAILIGCVILALFIDSAITYVPWANTLVNHAKTISLLIVLFYFPIRLLIFTVLKFKKHK